MRLESLFLQQNFIPVFKILRVSLPIFVQNKTILSCIVLLWHVKINKTDSCYKSSIAIVFVTKRYSKLKRWYGSNNLKSDKLNRYRTFKSTFFALKIKS